MKAYFITEKQLKSIKNVCDDAYQWHASWGNDDAADECINLAKNIEYQAIATEHEWMDDKLVDKLALELFKMGKYLDCLQSTLSQYAEKDAQEMLGNIWQTRDYMEVLLRKKVEVI